MYIDRTWFFTGGFCGWHKRKLASEHGEMFYSISLKGETRKWKHIAQILFLNSNQKIVILLLERGNHDYRSYCSPWCFTFVCSVVSNRAERLGLYYTTTLSESETPPTPLTRHSLSTDLRKTGPKSLGKKKKTCYR